ncbi:MAG TPA: bifunctional GNAT family N-acetyltransferase/carbon-nitrogen hydrolase family protein [Perlabentimonas sp.]|nr:bifunctional GNAT family N-acetyltransferase/carbon-nitrogen hydrolase family protein [Perlabentimonas sp.]
MKDDTGLMVSLRNLELNDYLDLKEAMNEVYPGSSNMHWEKDEIATLLKLFPEGQLCVEMNNTVVACALSVIVDYKKLGDKHTYGQVTGDSSFSNHNPNGDVLYGIEVFVHPDYRGLRLARRLYDARKELCESLNLRAIVAGGRMPLYKKYANELSPREYINKVEKKEIYDPVLTFQMSNGFHVKKILKNYLSADAQSLEYATLLQWHNIYYEKEENPMNVPKTTVRLGLVQWQMRSHPDFDSLVEQIEFFVDAVSDYSSDFILFPELFNAPLMAPYNNMGAAEAMRKLSEYTLPLLEKFKTFAISYNINIITGSMPVVNESDNLQNVSYLCHRNGEVDEYRKIHITPNERQTWGMVGGDRIKVFDTDCGKVGIVVCYDVQFPELIRLLADQGMSILFVPFLTDTQNGYVRVRNCAMARAVENECYVAMAGCVGNLPKVNNMDIQYAQSAVFTPSDFAFPTNSVKAETTPNTEMTLIVDVDLDLLKELHNHGSVHTMTDRRNDLYDLRLNER